MTTSTGRQNRLASETSPYLLQHARNPVDWYPWGPEALERAKKENRPILLSIGYAACHWCHVMERESFENEDVARVMNENFVCIKVDREERPDLDDIYMAATVAMTGHGGWPMTVFLTPEQAPFFAGTYFPPDDQSGRPGFKTLLSQIADVWRTQRERVVEQAAELTEHVRGQSEVLPGSQIGAESLAAAARQLAASFDAEHGGFGGAPKFPPSASLSLLLRIHRKSGDASLLRMVTATLDAMKNGGIYDHLGGGFARYSVDERWLVPHFEKMLYDNAQLARVYLEAFQVTNDGEYRRVAAETLDYVIREMQGADGGYYSATDADSEGVEGKFFVWKADELDEVLGRPAAEWFSEYFAVTPEGNFEGENILHTPRTFAEVAKELGVPEAELRRSIDESKRALYAARARRVPPLTDDKVLAAWNGLMISAMAEGARVLGDGKYLESGVRAAEFALKTLARPDGGLFRTARAGKAHLDAYLEDYAFLGDALVDLYEAGAADSFLRHAERLATRIVQDFSDAEGSAFFHTGGSHEALIARPREGHDGAIPNANAVAARLLSRLSFHLDRSEHRERALAALRAYGRAMERAPRAFATALSVVDLLLEGPVELAFVGSADGADTRALREEVARHYLPNRIIAHAEPGAASSLPLLQGKTVVGGRAALYVCKNFTCQAPITEPGQIASALQGAAADLHAGRGSRVGERRLEGAATGAGTRAFAERFAGLGRAYVPLGTTGLTVSRLGFGTYRVDDRVDEHRVALRLSLESGVNLIDTSTNYGDGHAERLVGEAVAALSGEGKLDRGSVVVVSKIGYAQGANYELLQSREASGKPVPEVVKYGDGLWHCIHPDWIEDQLGRSLERLGMDALDVCLLHNPEYFLGHATKSGMSVEEAREAFYRRVTAAFRRFETEIQQGRLRFYGVSSNTLVEPAADPEATSVSRFLSCAREAGGDHHHFRVLQLPMNLLESGALFERNTGEGSARTALECAEAAGLAVLVNRPLNAIMDGRLVRLSDPPELGDAPSFAEQLARVRSLEGEFGKTIAPSLQVEGGRPEHLFRWADQLASIGADIGSFEEWMEIEQHGVGPRVFRTVQSLDHGIRGPLATRWEAFRDRYLEELEGLFVSLRKRAADRSRRRAMALGRAIDPLLTEDHRTASLSRKALHALASAPGVTSVLVGMREEAYVRDAIGMMGWPPSERAKEIFEAARGVEV